MQLTGPLRFSVVLPVYNEQDCLDAVLPELVSACERLGAYELIAVDDGSSDDSYRLLVDGYATHNPKIRVLRLDENSGQSAAMWTGFQAARGPIVVTLDADGQNDPADIRRVVECVEGGADVCCGFRETRHDSMSKRLGSRLANAVRKRILKDGIRDTGCPMKAYRAQFLKPLQYWNGMHRFLPALCQMQGAHVEQIPVSHRSRAAGKSKYTNWGRLMVTVRDLRGVAWLKSRSRRLSCREWCPGEVP